MKKTIRIEDKPRPHYSINRLSTMLGADRRTLTLALKEFPPEGKGANGPTYRKWTGVRALLIRKRGTPDTTLEELFERLLYASIFGGICSQEHTDALARFDLAKWRGVSPDELEESID